MRRSQASEAWPFLRVPPRFVKACATFSPIHPGVELRENLKSIFHKCHLWEVAVVWELSKVTIHLPLGCLQDGRDLGGGGPAREGVGSVAASAEQPSL